MIHGKLLSGDQNDWSNEKIHSGGTGSGPSSTISRGRPMEGEGIGS